MTRVNEPGEGIDLESGDLSFAKHTQPSSKGSAFQAKEIASLKQRVLDEQSAFDKMEELYLKCQEKFRALEFALLKEKEMLKEQRRLMGLSNQAVVGLEERLDKYGDHLRTCKKRTLGRYYMEEPLNCDCDFEDSGTE